MTKNSSWGVRPDIGRTWSPGCHRGTHRDERGRRRRRQHARLTRLGVEQLPRGVRADPGGPER